MSTPASPRLLKWWLGIHLAQLRKDAGLDRSDTAKRLRVTKQSVGHLETGRSLPDHATLEVLLDFYGVAGKLDDLANVLEVAKRGKNWWHRLGDAVPPWFDLFLGLESGASELSIYVTYVMPGLFQTPEYAEAVIRSDPDLSDTQVRKILEVRMGRQQILDRGDDEDPVRISAVVDESVLRRTRGDVSVMAAQLDHLLDLADRPRIDLQVLPLDTGAHLGQRGDFQLMGFQDEFEGIPKVAYLDLLTEAQYYEDAAQVAAYERAMTNLHVRAASPEESRAIIKRARKEVGT